MKAVSRLIALSVLSLASLNVAALPIMSGDGTESCTTYLGACTVRTIDRHPAWQTSGAGSAWISFGDTGWSGQDLVPNSTVAPAASFFETLTLTSFAELSLKVWGDDTVQVFLNDVAQNLPDFSQDSACAGGGIGCEPDEFGDFFWSLAAGTYTLRFDVYQVGGGPFGLLYTGNTTSVPEPGTIPLLITGFVMLVLTRRRRAH